MDPQAERRIESLTRNLLDCYEELDLIYRLSRQGMSSFEAQKHVEFILKEAMEFFEADVGWVSCSDQDLCYFSPVRVGVDPGLWDGLHERVVNKLLQERKSRILHNLKGDLGPGFESCPDAFLFTLMQTDAGVYGTLCVGRTSGREFTAGELKLADVMASQAGIALENTSLHRKRVVEEQRLARLQEEFRLAHSIQENLLPKTLPSVPGYDIAGCTLPARSVGGDYYDFIPMTEGRLALALGDVSGKGMPAAMLMAHLQAAIRGQTLMLAEPSLCLARSNMLLFQSTDTDRFATCFYGVLDATSHELRYANAGHDRPMLIPADGDRLRELGTGGLVLGVLPDAAYGEETVPIAPGDTLVIYSDGIIDAEDGEDRAFGLDRLTRLVVRNRQEGARDLIQRILDDVNEHAHGVPQTDDMTLVVLRRL